MSQKLMTVFAVLLMASVSPRLAAENCATTEENNKIEIYISSKIVVDPQLAQAVFDEIRDDNDMFAKKWNEVDGVNQVEIIVDRNINNDECVSCEQTLEKEHVDTQMSQDEVTKACACGKPKRKCSSCCKPKACSSCSCCCK